VFSYEDHINLCRKESEFKLQRISASDFESNQHKFYKYLSDAFGRGMTLEEHWKTCNRNSYKPYSLNVIKEMQDKYEKYKKDNHVCDFDDMIKDFIDKAKEPDIDALIVDEAQDSNIPQTKALDKMATKLKNIGLLEIQIKQYLNLQGLVQKLFINYQKGLKR
tara:strand:- start:320 stop:808 length:489 start_codon:yes stop_codon:yes gene_type:complete